MCRSLIRVLIVDDFPVVRAGLRVLIETEPDMRVTAEAADAAAAIELFKTHCPDVVLLDLQMPEINGLQAIRQMRAACAGDDCRVVVLTGARGDEAVRQALDAGAQGYLLKTAAPLEITGAIRQVAAGKRYLPPAVRACLAERAATESLTARELEILELIVHGLSNAEIARRISVTEGTVKGHVNRLLGKLQVTDRTQAAIAALGRGIFLWTQAEIAEKFSRL